MIKKILFILLTILFAFVINWFKVNNGGVVINFTSYQILTSTNFLICSILSICVILFLIKKIVKLVLRPVNWNKKINNYSNFIVQSFIFNDVKDFSNANKFLKKAERIFNNNLIKLLRYKILNEQGDFENATKIFSEIDTKIDLNLLKVKLDFETAIKKQSEDIEIYANNVLIIEPSSVVAIKSLLKIYLSKNDYKSANEIFEKGLKLKIFNKKQNEFLTISKNLGQYYYNKNDFLKTKGILKDANKYFCDIDNVILLAKTYIVLGRKFKVNSLIENTWKKITNNELLNVYYLINDVNSIRDAKNLVKLNPKSADSYFALARAYYNNKLYKEAKDSAKSAEKIQPSRHLYKLMLNIEKDSNGNVADIGLLENKIN
jgi:uncharacterized membrane-anchored protein